MGTTRRAIGFPAEVRMMKTPPVFKHMEINTLQSGSGPLNTSAATCAGDLDSLRGQESFHPFPFPWLAQA